jgi:DNA gyrase subunit A
MGVKLMKTSEESKVVSLAKIIAEREEVGPEVEEIDSEDMIIKTLYNSDSYDDDEEIESNEYDIDEEIEEDIDEDNEN